MSVCLTVCQLSSKLYENFLSLLYWAAAWSSFDEIRYALCTSGFVDDAVFSIMGPMACGIASIYVSAVLEQVVTHFKRIPQVAPRCLTLSSYTMAANCAPGGVIAIVTCGAPAFVGGLQRAA